MSLKDFEVVFNYKHEPVVAREPQVTPSRHIALP
jgi:hypothetical protein